MLSNGECDLHPREHPIVDKDLRGIGHGFLHNLSFCISSSIGWPKIFLVSRLFTISMSMRSSFLVDVLRN